ncbi:MAG TPA: PHB depolymerase family esterase [Mycobacteriales bacterium]|nr:PHB depolymerase family esterase [Mycobacteriales bacterium]
MAATVLAVTTAVSLLILCLPQASGAASGAGCTLTPTSGTISRAADGRPYYVNVPAGLAGPAPLLLALHGFTQLPLDHEAVTGWSQVAAARHFIVAYPSAQPERSAWNFSQGSADVSYLRNVVQDISSKWCVNPRQVHAEGHSSGALMTARLACDASAVFASVAVYAGVDPTLLGSPCAPERPISVGVFHGVTDLISSFPLAVQHRNNWLLRNGCPFIPKTEPNVVVEASVYGPCRAGVVVVWRVYLAGHLWPTGADHTDITQRMWDFFVHNPLPATA